jgi:hypothetical protein
MRILLIADDRRIVRYVSDRLKPANIPLTVRRKPAPLAALISRERPNLIINTVFYEFGTPLAGLDLPDSYRIGADFRLIDTTAETLDAIPLLIVQREVETLLQQEAGTRSSLTPLPLAPRRSIRRGTGATDAELNPALKALLHAKEVFAGVVSAEEAAPTHDNRVAVPVPKEVLATIDSVLSASIHMAASPVATAETVSALGSIVAFFQRVEAALDQLEKTATAAVKTAGVISVLLGAVAAVVTSLGTLVAAFTKLL